MSAGTLLQAALYALTLLSVFDIRWTTNNEVRRVHER